MPDPVTPDAVDETVRRVMESHMARPEDGVIVSEHRGIPRRMLYGHSKRLTVLREMAHVAIRAVTKETRTTLTDELTQHLAEQLGAAVSALQGQASAVLLAQLERGASTRTVMRGLALSATLHLQGLEAAIAAAEPSVIRPATRLAMRLQAAREAAKLLRETRMALEHVGKLPLRSRTRRPTPLEAAAAAAFHP